VGEKEKISDCSFIYLFMAKVELSGTLLQVVVLLASYKNAEKFYLSNGKFGVHKEKSPS